MIRLLAVTAVALSTTVALAQKTMPGDRVYDLQPEQQGSCQSMNWHIVATAAGVLSGMIAWGDMKVVARVAGTITPLVKGERDRVSICAVNPQDRTFQMIATEARGRKRIANIDGTIWHNGWLTASIQGLSKYQGAVASGRPSLRPDPFVQQAPVAKRNLSLELSWSGASRRARFRRPRPPLPEQRARQPFGRRRGET